MALENEASRQGKRAARWIWWVGSAESLLCVFGLRLGASLSSVVSTDSQAMIVTGIMVLGLLPAVVYIACGFGIRAGHPGATAAALLLVLMQLIVVCFLLGRAVLGAIVAASPHSLSTAVVLWGTPLLLLTVAARALVATRPWGRKVDLGA